jgi:hypothetical protein
MKLHRHRGHPCIPKSFSTMKLSEKKKEKRKKKGAKPQT